MDKKTNKTHKKLAQYTKHTLQYKLLLTIQQQNINISYNSSAFISSEYWNNLYMH